MSLAAGVDIDINMVGEEGYRGVQRGVLTPFHAPLLPPRGDKGGTTEQQVLGSAS